MIVHGSAISAFPGLQYWLKQLYTTSNVTSDAMTSTGILGLDHLVIFGAKMDLSKEPFQMTLCSRRQNVVHRLETCSELAPHTLSLMSETTLEPSESTKNQVLTVIIPATVKAGEYRIRLTRQTQEDYPQVSLLDTATEIGRSNVLSEITNMEQWERICRNSGDGNCSLYLLGRKDQSTVWETPI
jgi:hypothetical protein